MWEWLQDNAWAGWAAAAVLLAVAELLSLDLTLLMLAGGALAGAVTAALTASLALSVAVAAVVSLALLSLVRPGVVGRLHSGPELTTGHAALVGKTGVVVAPVSDLEGRVQLQGELWTARSYDPDATIPTGTKVRVFEIDGATAVVLPD